MIVQVGDKVRFLNEKGEGVITRIINELAYVLVEEGFEIPVKLNQLVFVEKRKHAELKSTIEADNQLKNYNYIERNEMFLTEDNFQPISKVFIPENELTNDLYFGFISSSVNNENIFSLYLINDTANYYTFCLFFKNKEGYTFVENGNLEPNTKIFISELKKEDLVNINNILFQAISFSAYNKEKGNFFEKEVIVQPIYLLNNQYYKGNDFFDEPAFLISLTSSDQFLEKIKNQKITDDLSTQKVVEEIKKDVNNELLEVDLHIHELTADTSGLNASQMLNIQINHFRKKMEEAITNPRIKKIVFIHGVGGGTLKLELRRILSREYGHYDYHDASFAEYGYGATMVILRR